MESNTVESGGINDSADSEKSNALKPVDKVAAEDTLRQITC